MRDATDRRLSRRAMLKSAAAAALAVTGASVGRAAAAAPTSNSKVRAMFSRERFVAECAGAAAESDSQGAVAEILARAVADHRAVLAALGPPQQAGLEVLHRSARLTIFAAKWAPHMALPVHDHRLWALIGIYVGREDNILWRRKPGGIEAVGARVLFPGEVAALPADAIHSVTNPLASFTGGIHIYGGDFFATPRSQWDDESLREEPSNGDAIQALFARENARLHACASH